MAEGRVTQAPLLVLEETTVQGRVTQAAVLALYTIAVPSRATQAAALALVQATVQARVTQTPILVLYRNGGGVSAEGGGGCAVRECQCWRITRTDGQIFGFTTHDEDVTFRGTLFKRCDSLRASAVNSTANSGTATGDVQVSGILSDAGISQRDLYAGRFDNAVVEVFLVNWDTLQGRVLTRGVVARTTQREGDYNMTALTGGRRLEQQPLLEVYSPVCRYELGDSRCKVNLPALQVSGSVVAVPAANVVTQARRRQFADSTRTEAEIVFRNGRLTFTSGANNGLRFEVKSIVGAVITLWQPTPFDIEVGATYTLVPGCGKTSEECISRFNNYVNFGGFPDLPGNDAINLTPDRT